MKSSNLVELLRYITFLPLVIVLVAMASGAQSRSTSDIELFTAESVEIIGTE